MKDQNIYVPLAIVQEKLKAPKDLNNSFGGYRYRSAESILEAVKPLLFENGLVINISDKMINLGNRYYVEATVTISDMFNNSVQTTALAREAEDKKGMDDAQITGAASSYARKYALNGMFAIDDTKDPDTDEHRNQQNRPKATKETIPASSRATGKPEAMGEKPVSILDKARLDIGEELKRQGYNRPDTMIAFIHDVLGKDKIDNIEEAILVANALDDNANLNGENDE